MRFHLLLTLLVSGALSAQVPAAAPAPMPTIEVGLRIRVVAARRFEGTLMSQSPEALVLASTDGARHEVRPRDVQRLDVSAGVRAFDGALHGTIIGALVGVGVMSWLSAPVGLVVGAAIGKEHWTRLYPPRTCHANNTSVRCRGAVTSVP